ncbi:glycosyltransferase family 2 protein [Aestuariicella hydrocarbonica]|uniref:Glycosyltransferase family 2 protein n=1 Tax=Pseudomaricurvus hydrocarbonicus TaxID=1470433 RepID=A0A9E5JSU0_9GAMM|nr:glycosyltransferase family 2 protein [Aestuariicella hydrocarbonica]NHO64669.1 glycosyltransferase family 2 protein [Aestuariicella hydrocarbonica]
MINTCPALDIVIPCYNEEEVLAETASRISELLCKMIRNKTVAATSCILFVDDGSADTTWQLISELSRQYPHIRGIQLSRNRGHQNALLAGLANTRGDAVVSIDADLQDDINVIEDMVNCFKEGNDIVYGVRDDRSTDTFFKRHSAILFYRLLRLMGIDIIINHADYRLLSRRALQALNQHQEVNLFLRGIVPTLGFNSCKVTYKRNERFAGESKYPLKKMLALAFDGITSFSAVPLRAIAILGILVFAFSMLISLWALWVRLFTDTAVPGWASSVLPIYLLGGLQLLGMGVVGEYVAKVYLETKRRPKYFIADSIEEQGRIEEPEADHQTAPVADRFEQQIDNRFDTATATPRASQTERQANR